MARKRKATWQESAENFDFGKITRISTDRTSHVRDDFGRGFMTLRDLCTSCYLQGVADVAATMADRPDTFRELLAVSPPSYPFDPIAMGM